MARVEIDGLAPVVVPEATLRSWAYHLSGNGDSVEELWGLMRHAERGGGLLYDVGANEGVFALTWCAAHTGNRVVAFEPGGGLLKRVGAGAAASGMADRVDLRELWIDERAGTHSGVIDWQGFFVPREGGDQTVRRVTLDAFVAESGARPDAIKIDVEGGELEVLRGALGTLEAWRPVVFLEVHPELLRARGVATRTVLEPLLSAGYRLRTPLGRRLAPWRVASSYRAVMRLVAEPA
jgi:FkbM family methyltransferase